MTSDIQPITLELIKELRANGQAGTAADLLSAYHRSRLKGREQDRLELRRNEARKEQALKRHYGLCRAWGCQSDTEDGRSACAYHREKFALAAKKSKENTFRPLREEVLEKLRSESELYKKDLPDTLRL